MSLPRLHIDFNNPSFIASPWDTFAELRDKTPVFYDEVWNQIYFSRYEDIAALLKDKRLGRALPEGVERPPSHPAKRDFDTFQSKVFMDWEPPDHTRIRGLVSKVFTPQRVESLRGKIEATVHKLIDGVQARGQCDFVHDLSEPLPVIVISDLLGVPEEHRAKLRPWSDAIVKMYELGHTEAQMWAASQAAREFMALIGELAEARRRHPQDDLITGLVQVEEAGERLSEDEMRATCIFLLNAGHEASVNGASLGLMALFRHPAQLALLQQAANDPAQAGLFKTACEEMLRFESPLPMFERWVLQDVDFHGVELKRGSEVGLFYASGNRDPRRFENPDQLDVTRKDNAHLTFGLGIHYCLGAPLARLEMQILFKTLLQRLPNIRPAGEPVFNSGFIIRGLKTLPIAF